MKQIKVVRWYEIEMLLIKIYGKVKPTIYQVSTNEKLLIGALHDAREAIDIPLERKCYYCNHYEDNAGMYEMHSRCKLGRKKDAAKCEKYSERYIKE